MVYLKTTGVYNIKQDSRKSICSFYFHYFLTEASTRTLELHQQTFNLISIRAFDVPKLFFPIIPRQ